MNDNQYFAIGFGADGRRNDHTNRKFAAADSRVLKRSKKAELTTLELEIYTHRLFLPMVVIAVMVVVEKSRTDVGIV